MKNKPTTQLLVNAIKHGTVIDHITPGQGVKIVAALKLSAHNKIVTLGLNLPSRTMKKKDLIKVEDRELLPEEADSVAILAPNATINIIRDYATIKKFEVQLPKTLTGLIICPNPKCITNHERMTTIFTIVRQKPNVIMRCHYCEKTFHRDEVTIASA